MNEHMTQSIQNDIDYIGGGESSGSNALASSNAWCRGKFAKHTEAVEMEIGIYNFHSQVSP